MPTRGYQSSVSPVLHFGLGKFKQVDSLVVVWPLGNRQLLKNIKCDQILTVDEGVAHLFNSHQEHEKPLFNQVKSPISYTAPKNIVNDFNRQPLMVNPMSFFTPCMIKEDVNGDGLEDVFIGGANGNPGRLYIQQKDGTFTLKKEPAFEADKDFSEVAAVFFDANGDGKPDLYVCSGGYGDLLPEDSLLQDHLYLNNGHGVFVRSKNGLPSISGSKSCVKVADINGDGYPDLFVGGRVVPGRYPESPESYILINDGKGHFSDQTLHWAPQLQSIGMVTDAAWIDMDGDHKPDLVLVGEWMPVTILINHNGKLLNQTKDFMDQDYSGWWNSLAVADVNHDGFPDLIIGNQGLNTQYASTNSEPAEMYYKDFDGNGSIDPILCFYIHHKSYPYLTRDELFNQMTVMRTRFPTYQNFASATIDSLFTPDEMQGAHHLIANDFKTVCFLSNHSKRLHEKQLPIEAQNSPVFTITLFDYDHDGNTDLLLCGNINRARLRFGKYDANYGFFSKGTDMEILAMYHSLYPVLKSRGM